MGRVASDVFRGMGVTQFIGAGHIAIQPPPLISHHPVINPKFRPWLKQMIDFVRELIYVGIAKK